MIVKINRKEEFDEIVLKNEGKVIIDFYADWCGPCRMLSPILEEISNENEDITIYKINVEENQDLATQYMITSIPTILLMNYGKTIETLIGLRSKEDILKVFN